MSKDSANNPPSAQGVRQQWTDIPPKIRELIEEYLGSQVVKTETQHGGFSPGVAARLYTADNQCVFLKALGTELNPTSVNFHRKEIKINDHLPENNFAPRLLWSIDDAEDTEWAALLFENVAGSNPPTPWREENLQRVMQAMKQLTDTLTPSPIAAGEIPNASDYFSGRIRGWQPISANEAAIAKLDAWSQQHLAALCEFEGQAPQAVTGQTLVHFDIRADNIVMSDEGIWFVDWPHACIGAEWLDVVLFAPSVAMQGGLQPEELIQLHPACQQAEPDDITATVASVAGMLTLRSLQPPPPGLPTLRQFQTAQAKTARQWVAERTGWQ